MVKSSGRKIIQLIDSEKYLQFGNTLIRSKGIVEFILSTSDTIYHILILVDIINIDIPEFQDPDTLDGKSLLVDNVPDRPCNRIITDKKPLRYVDKLKVKLFIKGNTCTYH